MFNAKSTLLLMSVFLLFLEPLNARVFFKVKKGVNLKKNNDLLQLLVKHSVVEEVIENKWSHIIGSEISLATNPYQLVYDLKKMDLIEFAYVDELVPLDFIIEDKNITKQWHHENIKTKLAWNYSEGRGVKVAVCDTGVDANHSDLNSNILLPGFNVVDNSNDIKPVHPHGTMVSGLISAIANKSFQTHGIAPLTKIIPIKVSNERDGSAYYSDLAECILYAVDVGAKVINLSYGGAHTQVINAAAKYARNAGALLVMAAGNEGEDISAWNDWDSFTLVGATTSSNELTFFSNYGEPVDIVAPGLNILTTTMTSLGANSPYSTSSGTSFASPIVAAAAAMIYSMDQSLSNSEVQSILYRSADASIGSAFEVGHGLLKINKALELANKKKILK